MKCELTKKPACNTTNFRGLNIMISIQHVVQEYNSREEFLNALFQKIHNQPNSKDTLEVEVELKGGKKTMGKEIVSLCNCEDLPVTYCDKCNSFFVIDKEGNRKELLVRVSENQEKHIADLFN